MQDSERVEKALKMAESDKQWSLDCGMDGEIDGVESPQQYEAVQVLAAEVRRLRAEIEARDMVLQAARAIADAGAVITASYPAQLIGPLRKALADLDKVAGSKA